MKIGVLSYERQPLALDGRDCQNIGDYIQSYAMREILEELSLTQNIESISKYELSVYDGDYLFLVINCFDTLTNYVHIAQSSYPISKKIIPCFISYSLASEISPDIANYLKLYEPIGCRDEYTMENMRQNGIKAYMTGCVTALLPRTAIVPQITNGKVMLVDSPASLEPFIPKKLSHNIERFSAIYHINRTDGQPYLQSSEYKEITKYTMERMEYCRKNASLVVTSRLHVASPCMAMGIPVIFAADNIDERFAWLDKFLPLYSRDNFKDIDWNPAPVDYEEDKKYIKEIIKKKITEEWSKVKDIYDLSNFYENRKKVTINKTIYNYLLKVPIQHNKIIRYAIWGTVYKSGVIKRAIDHFFPKWVMTHAIDLNCEGMFEGVIIEKPEVIDFIADVDIYIIVPQSAYEFVSKTLKEKNQKFILIDYTGCSWSENITDF